MNRITDLINGVLDLGESLNNLGVQVSWLVAVGLLFLITFLISAREVLSWYLKTQKIAAELGLQLEHEFSAGPYHWGLVFIK